MYLNKPKFIKLKKVFMDRCIQEDEPHFFIQMFYSFRFACQDVSAKRQAIFGVLCTIMHWRLPWQRTTATRSRYVRRPPAVHAAADMWWQQAEILQLH